MFESLDLKQGDLFPIATEGNDSEEKSDLIIWSKSAGCRLGIPDGEVGVSLTSKPRPGGGEEISGWIVTVLASSLKHKLK